MLPAGAHWAFVIGELPTATTTAIGSLERESSLWGQLRSLCPTYCASREDDLVTSTPLGWQGSYGLKEASWLFPAVQGLCPTVMLGRP
jgi:hypothetical protein